MTDVVIKEPPLTNEEKSWLNRMEIQIERSLAGFYIVGQNLIAIRDNKLYREKYKTFEEYCQKRWCMGRNYANRLIGASHVVDNLKSNDDEFDGDEQIGDQKMSPIGDKMVPIGTKNEENPNWQLPTTESQARPLTKLLPNLQKKAWLMALETAGNKRVTAKDVSKAVAIVSNEEFKESTQRIKKRVGQDKLLSDDFKRKFLIFMSAIEEAKAGGWKDTSKAVAMNYIYSLKAAIEF